MNIRVNDRIFSNDANGTFDKTFPEYERVGNGSYQGSEGEDELYYFMYHSDGKLLHGIYKFNKDFLEISEK